MSQNFRSTTESKTCDHCGTVFYRDKRCTWAWWKSARFCSRLCSGEHFRATRPQMPPIEQHFMARVDRSGDCWIWAGAADRHGYGAFSYGGKMYKAHRLSLEIHKGPSPNGATYACHTCDEPMCVNPDHMYWGTPQDNSNDKIDRNRQTRGEDIHCSKLTAADVRKIRSDTRTNTAVAKDFGVSPSNISMIRTRTTWRHV